MVLGRRRDGDETGGRPTGPRARTLVDLPNHALLDGGRIVGLWEFDVDSRSIMWATFDGTREKARAKAVEETEGRVRDELGDARSFSLDSPKSRAGRFAALRNLG